MLNIYFIWGWVGAREISGQQCLFVCLIHTHTHTHTHKVGKDGMARMNKETKMLPACRQSKLQSAFSLFSSSQTQFHNATLTITSSCSKHFTFHTSDEYNWKLTLLKQSRFVCCCFFTNVYIHIGQILCTAINLTSFTLVNNNKIYRRIFM